MHTAVYAGVPAANSAIAIAQKTLDELNDRGEHFVQSLERGLAVIRAFGADDPELTLSDVARRTGLTRAAARRFLLTLVDLGYVRTDGKQFALTPRVLDLGYAFLSSLRCPRSPSRTSSASPPSCASRARCPCSTATRSSTSAACPRAGSCASRSTSAPASRPTRPRWAASCSPALPERRAAPPTWPAPRSRPLTRARDRQRRATSSRELDRVREQGWALVDQELEEGLRSIAAPVRDASGRTIAAVNVSAHASRVSARGRAGRRCSRRCWRPPSASRRTSRRAYNHR